MGVTEQENEDMVRETTLAGLDENHEASGTPLIGHHKELITGLYCTIYRGTNIATTSDDDKNRICEASLPIRFNHN